MDANAQPSRVSHERWEQRLAEATWLETAMVVLSFIWIGLIAAEFVYGERIHIQAAIYCVWAVFVVDFVLRFMQAPSKAGYVRANWLTALSLVLPAFRVLRLARLLRLTRATQLLKVIGSVNRGMRSLGRTFGQRGLPYVAMLTAMVTILGAAAIYAFEKPPVGTITNYADAIWFTSMLMTTMGSGYWPVSPEGRILCFILSLYAFAMFGYFTAALASFFVGEDRASKDKLHDDLKVVRTQLSDIQQKLDSV